LRDRGVDVSVLTRSRRDGADDLSGIQQVLGDIAAPETHQILVEQMSSSDAVVYAVGALYPAETVDRPWLDLYTSLPPFLAMLEASMHAPDARLIFLSSGGTVYGEQGLEPITEDASRVPVSSYGITKLAAELYLAEHCRRSGTVGTSLRISNAYGPGQRTERGQGAVGAFMAAALSGEPVPFFGDGSVVRDYVHVDDVASAIALLLESDGWVDALNIGSGTGTSLRELVGAIESVTARSVPLIRKEGRNVDLPANVLNPSRAKCLLGWSPRELHRGLEETWSELSAK
jgi:UDP-glucose 4-epimerase